MDIIILKMFFHENTLALCLLIVFSAHKNTVELETLCFDLTLQVLDREAQMDNPCKWLSAVAWDNITELDK